MSVFFLPLSINLFSTMLYFYMTCFLLSVVVAYFSTLFNLFLLYHWCCVPRYFFIYNRPCIIFVEAHCVCINLMWASDSFVIIVIYMDLIILLLPVIGWCLYVYSILLSEFCPVFLIFCWFSAFCCRSYWLICVLFYLL